MRMMPLLAVVISLGLSMMILGGLGVSDYLGDGGQVGLEEEIESQANSDQSIDPEEGDDGGFLSFVVSSISQMRDLTKMMVFLPSTLESLGAPAVVARAIGHGAQLVIVVGLVQVALQYNVR